jgi:hypothetical protein
MILRKEQNSAVTASYQIITQKPIRPCPELAQANPIGILVVMYTFPVFNNNII